MESYVVDFKDIQKNDIEIAGGKGANLGEMTQAKLMVPEGFVVTTAAYRSFMRHNGLDEMKAEDLVALKASIEKGTFPADLMNEITLAYEKLIQQQDSQKGNNRVAVRSSATAEDLEDASFAGQQETYLNIIGTDELLNSIKKCFASLWGNRAVDYRKSHGFDQNVALAVVVQRMICSEKSGVLFTADPLTSNRDNIRINASYGLGESIVSGLVTADSFVCDKKGNLVDQTIGEKKVQTIYAKEGGTIQTPVDEAKRLEASLSEKEIKSLVNQALLVEKHYKKPMDIEWAIKDEKVYILQARAITTLKNKESDEKQEEIINAYVSKCKIARSMRDNMKFILEKLPAPMYPLDDYCVGAINNQKANIFRKVGIEMSMQPQVDDLGINILPSATMKIHKEIFNFSKVAKEIKDYPHCREEIDKSLQFYSKELEDIKKADYSSMSAAEAARQFVRIMELVERLSYDRFYYALFPSFFADKKILKILKKADTSLTSFDLYANLDYRTALVSKGVANIAKEIKLHSKIKDAVLSGMKYDELTEKFPEIRPCFEEFLKQHGYKLDFNCYCIFSTSYIDDPDRLVNIVKPLLKGEEMTENPDKYASICKKLSAIFSEKEYEECMKFFDDFRYFHICREESQYMWETAFCFGRSCLKKISEKLFNTDNFKENIAYLFIDEFKTIAVSGDVSQELKDKINMRKANRELACKVWDRCKGVVFGEAKEVLKGISGSRGEATSVARVILSPSEFYKMQKGDVLVCSYTDPEWTPLFRLASAVVADTGAELSHAAIVAREYGIPAVLGVGYGTTRFKDGDMIYVNGNVGTVAAVGIESFLS